MDKIKAIFLVGTIICLVFLAGCTGTEVKEDDNNIFTSNVVKLLDYSIDRIKDRQGIVGQIDLTGRIENIVDHKIDLKITANFYDSDNNFLGSSNYRILGLRAKPDAGHSTTFEITYREQNANKFDHFMIKADEIV